MRVKKIYCMNDKLVRQASGFCLMSNLFTWSKTDSLYSVVVVVTSVCSTMKLVLWMNHSKLVLWMKHIKLVLWENCSNQTQQTSWSTFQSITQLSMITKTPSKSWLHVINHSVYEYTPPNKIKLVTNLHNKVTRTTIEHNTTIEYILLLLAIYVDIQPTVYNGCPISLRITIW